MIKIFGKLDTFIAFLGLKIEEFIQWKTSRNLCLSNIYLVYIITCVNITFSPFTLIQILFSPFPIFPFFCPCSPWFFTVHPCFFHLLPTQRKFFTAFLNWIIQELSQMKTSLTLCFSNIYLIITPLFLCFPLLFSSFLFISRSWKFV